MELSLKGEKFKDIFGIFLIILMVNIILLEGSIGWLRIIGLEEG